MAALITEQIGEQSFELVLDRICQVLTLELDNQSTLQANPDLKPEIFKERIVPVTHAECPVLNVALSKGEYDIMTSISKDGTYMFDIDAYFACKSSLNERGDTKAMIKLHRLIGVIRAILSHHKYRLLGFPAPFIEHTEVKEINIADPANTRDATSTVFARITFIVRVPEKTTPIEPSLLAKSSYTTVKLKDTDKGYLWIIEN